MNFQKSEGTLGPGSPEIIWLRGTGNRGSFLLIFFYSFGPKIVWQVPRDSKKVEYVKKGSFFEFLEPLESLIYPIDFLHAFCH